MTFNNIYKLVFCTFCVQIFCNIDYLCSIRCFCLWHASSSFCLFLIHSLSISAFGWCILYTVLTFLVFQSIFLIASNLQLMTPNCILILEQLMFQLLQFYSRISVSFSISLCSLSSIPKYVYIFPCSSSCISLLKSSIITIIIVIMVINLFTPISH